MVVDILLESRYITLVLFDEFTNYVKMTTGVFL